MKYYESNNKKSGGYGFYIIIAVCLVAIGAATWFAVSRFNSAKTPEAENSSREKGQSSEYNGGSSAYNDSSDVSSDTSMLMPDDSSAVGQTVSDQPDDRAESETEVKKSFILPVKGNISKDYSDTTLQYSATYGDMRLHTGADIVCEAGSKIKAASGGTVTSVEEGTLLGSTVTIDHSGGIIVKYCGLDKITVATGDTVQSGSEIGVCGDIPSECADESHIHIETTLNGKPASPMKALGFIE